MALALVMVLAYRIPVLVPAPTLVRALLVYIPALATDSGPAPRLAPAWPLPWMASPPQREPELTHTPQVFLIDGWAFKRQVDQACLTEESIGVFIPTAHYVTDR